MSLISLENVEKNINNQTIIKKVSLSIESGQTVGFVGRNGSGKTVLLKLICGIYTVSEGTVEVNNTIIGKETDFPKGVGIIIEKPGFLPELSGYRNLQLLAKIQKKIDSEKIRKAMNAVGLDPMEKKPVGKYSLGMKQRLGLAQAIMEDPIILILDEPFNGMDQNGAREMRSYLLELKRKGITMIIATHSSEDVEQLCDVVFEIDAGRIIKY